MTNLEAIKGALSYPLTSNAFILALTNRGLVETDTYVIGNKKPLELATADCIKTLLSTPNIAEGGYSVSLSDKATLMKMANGIYAKYGENSSLNPTATFKQVM
jgi:hypothetical protein